MMTFQHLWIKMINICFSEPQVFLSFCFYESKKQNDWKIINNMDLGDYFKTGQK